LGRIGRTSDISSIVLYLASDEAEWITGQVFLVDGCLMSGHYTLQGNHDHT
jgi:NAD(P)-dependent dehydrogenase (short-subunit alcohol dehydrogenase family)